MRRSLALLLFTIPLWAQFQPAPPQQPYPAQSQYPSAQGQYPLSQQQPYPAQGQPQPYPQDDQQAAAEDQQHGVARLRIVQGDVNIKRGDNGMLTGAIMNAPLLSRDHLETGPGSRAEVELDNASVIRLAPDTDLGFANLTFGNAQAQLGIGTAIVRIGANPQTQVELDTPSVSFRPLGPGEYRVSVFDNGTTQVTVRSGRLEMSGPRGSQTVEQGQSLIVRGDANDPEFQQVYEPARDQFDEWSNSRDAEMAPARSAQYVNADIYGAQDLDRYGTWGPSEYGQVWTPQGVGPDWSPYSNGQWSYGDYYGWTWIGYEPWGWAPYHYGRWFHASTGWCWWPGERLGFGSRWSPGLVSFFGFGGGLGWVSLAPHEFYHPWWGRGGYGGGYAAFRGGYDIHGFRNAGFRGGAITAGFNGFAGAGHRYTFADAGQLRSASMYRGGIPVSPSAASYRFSERSVYSSQRFSQTSSRTFFSRPSASFNNSRYGGNGGSYNGSRYATPPAGGNSGGGWQRFGSAAPQRQQQPQNFSSRPSTAGESGWHNFGQPQQQTAPRNNGGNGYGGSYRAPAAPSYNYRAPAAAPNYNYNRAPAAPSYNRVPAAPSYNRAPSAPSYNYRSPSPGYSAPRNNAPSYSAPRNNGGGGGGGSRPSAGGGGSHSSGGGGRHR